MPSRNFEDKNRGLDKRELEIKWIKHLREREAEELTYKMWESARMQALQSASGVAGGGFTAEITESYEEPSIPDFAGQPSEIDLTNPVNDPVGDPPFAPQYYYVSSSYAGTPSDGGPSTPWKSLSDVQNNFSSMPMGSIIRFKRGDTFTGTFSASRSGAAGNPIVFTSYDVDKDDIVIPYGQPEGNADRPKFTGSATGATVQRLFSVDNRSWINFENLWVRDTGTPDGTRTGEAKVQRAFVFTSWGTSDVGNCKVSNCLVEKVGVGVYTGPRSINNTVEICEFRDLRMVRSDAPNTGDNDYGANGVVVSSSRNLITRNLFYDNWANSIDYTYDGGGIELYADRNTSVSNNLITYNTFYDSNGGVEIGGASGSSHVENVFAYNKFINNGSGVLVQNSGTFRTFVDRIYFFNNVFVETQNSPRGSSSGLVRFRNTPTGSNSLIFENNIVQLFGALSFGRKLPAPNESQNQLDLPAFSHYNNAYLPNIGSTGALLNLTLQVSNSSLTPGTGAKVWASTSGNPLNWNYSPTGSSILIDSGKNQTKIYTNVGVGGGTITLTDFSGNAIGTPPNIGILEI
jgi:hypothetical protein